MTLYVYDAAYTRIGLVEHIDSLQWQSEYQDTGEVKLVCGISASNLALLVDGNHLQCDSVPEIAVIREVQITDDSESMTVRALPSVARWTERVVMATEQIADAEVGMLSLATKHRRGLHGETASAQGLTSPVDTQITWGSVLEAVTTLATASGLGFREIFDPQTKALRFEVYRGINRCEGAAKTGYFGDDIGNLSTVELSRGTADWKNVAIVGGQGEGADRKIVTVELGAYAGEDRRELWVDAKDISTTYQIATENADGTYTYTDATYTDAEYEAVLAARGLEKLAECLQRMEVKAELGQDLMTYGVDYNLGDVVPLKLTAYGMQLSARVQAIRTIYESTGKQVTAVLSDIALYDTIKEVSL